MNVKNSFTFTLKSLINQGFSALGEYGECNFYNKWGIKNKMELELIYIKFIRFRNEGYLHSHLHLLEKERMMKKMEKVVQVIAAPKMKDGKNAYAFVNGGKLKEEVEFLALLSDGTLRPMQVRYENGYFTGYEIAEYDGWTFRGMEENY